MNLLIRHAGSHRERITMSNYGLSTYADVFAFCGNSLLKPMTQTEEVGLDPAFWDAFPDFNDREIVSAIGRCKAFAEGAQRRKDEGEDVVERTAVEYTKLFIGPPSPAAPPWETMNRADGVVVGFGEPTVQMQSILRDMDLEVSNENNQYADHFGIELLVLSEMCRRLEGGTYEYEHAMEFLSKHPRSWVDSLRDKVNESYPDGYIIGIIDLSKNLMTALEKTIVY